jgi:hypothetical protein
MRNGVQWTLFFCFFISLLGNAQTNGKDLSKSAVSTTPQKLPEDLGTKKFEFGLAPGVGSVTYSEPGVMSEAGYLYGAKGYGQWTGQRLLLRSDLEILGGGLSYKGKDWSNQPKDSSTQDLLTHFGLQSGYRLPLKAFSFSFTLGGRARYWNQTIEGRGGYPRELTQIFVPLGLQIRHGENSRFDLTYRLEYAPLVYGQMFARLSKATDDAPDQVLRQNSGNQTMAAIDWRVNVSGAIHSLVGIYYRQSGVSKSQENKVRFNGQDVYIYEPENSTTELGLYTGLSF